MGLRVNAVWLVLGLFLAAAARTTGEAEIRALNVEDLGVPVSTMRRMGDFLVPKPGQKGWWFITSYNPVRRNTLPIQIYIVDLDARKVKMVKSNPSGALCYSLNSKGVMAGDGRFYMGHYAKTGVWRFDPGDGSLEFIDFPDIKDRVLPFCMQEAEDGKIYMGTASAKAYVIEYDPKSNQFRDFGVQGPKHPSPRYIYSMAVGKKYVYSAAGKNPWYLVATDRETMEQKVLISDPDYLEVSGRGGNCTARVSLKSRSQKPAIRKLFRLRDGLASETQPSKGKPRPKAAPRPELLLTLARPNSEGKAQIWFRMPGKDWSYVDLEGIQTTPWKSLSLKALPDGRLLGAPRGYEDFFIYDPAKNEFSIPGKAPLSAYTMQCLGGKVYIAGYPGTYMVEYDPAVPWTFFTTTPKHKEPPLSSVDSNPRECHRFGNLVQTHHARASAIGADGCIYVGAHAERLHVGGGLVWWNPKDRKPAGLRKPFLVQDCAGLTAARDGKLIVYSSTPVTDPRAKSATPKEAKLFVFDVATKKVTDVIVPVPGLQSCGPVTAIGDRILGVGRKAGSHLFYVFDLSEMKIILNRPLSSGTSSLKIGPDGRIYFLAENILKRLDPTTLAFESIGSIEKGGEFEFLEQDLYLAGYHLRRIRNVTTLGASKEVDGR
ncbi:MAG: hypothetical protein QGF00_25355 [Planctomycetota bacterium]|nr:hypothetical protein [Planctomycetota bacterium]MDP7252956.1 hypothetical protein [Planctomycetota bacterium]